MTHPSVPFAALAAALGFAAPAAAQGPAAADSLDLSLGQALVIGLNENPVVLQAAADRSASGAGVWDAWGNLLPQLSLQGSAQKSEQGTFVFFGTEFESPATYSTAYQWDFTHSLLDAGRDLFRIRGARAELDRVEARFDDTATLDEIGRVYAATGMLIDPYYTATDRPVQWNCHIPIITASITVGLDPQGEHAIGVHGANLDAGEVACIVALVQHR